MHVLVVKTSSMGDVLHTLPALTDAMKAVPGIHFDWVVEEAFAHIPGWHPAVNRVIPVAIRRWRKSWFSSANRRERAEFTTALQAREYDAVIDAQGLLKSAALVTRLAKGVRHGLDFKSARESLASWFYHQKHAIGWQEHAVERVRELMAKSLDYPKPVSKGDYAIAARFRACPDTDETSLVFLHATTRENKHWPEHHWRELIAMVEPLGVTVKLPWGVRHEQRRALRLAEGFSHVEVLPKSTLEQLAEVLSAASGVVSVDTGLSHLAAALDKPNITLYGPTNPVHIGAYGKNQHICQPKNSSNLQDLSAATVYLQLSTLLHTLK